jgi:hypothetical protein
MHFKIHSIFISIFLFFVFTSNAQNGLNFQGVARNTNNIILASQPISLRLSIIRTSVNGTTEYAEVRKVTTNAQGLFSVVIGDTGSISSLGNFATIDWKLGPKFLKIEMDVAAGNNFVLIGTTQFQSVAYAQFAQSVDAEKLNGIVPVEKGGTGTTSLAAFKTALSIDKNTVGLSNVNNTADTAKPVSNATKLLLDTKVSSETLSNTTAQLAPIASPTFTGTVRGITKTMVGLGNIDNTADTAKPISNATKLVLDTKVSTETFSSTILTKENAANKSTATNLGAAAASDILFPTQKAVKAYVDAQANAGGVADGGITTDKLAALAVTNAKLASGIDKAKVGLENVDNTSDAEKPISTATQLALDTKFTLDAYLDSLRSIPKLNRYNYYTEDNVFNGGETTIANLTLPNGILNLAAGTQIQSGAESPTVIQNRPNADFSIKTSTDEYGDGDPGAHEFKFTADGRLFFPDGGSRIVIDESQFGGQDVDVLSIRSKTGSYIQLRTSSEGGDDDIRNYWEFHTDGFLVFPDGYLDRDLDEYIDPSGNTKIGVNNDSPLIPIFELKSPLGISLTSGSIDDMTDKVSGIGISPRDQEGKVLIMTSEKDINTYDIFNNLWTYDSKGLLTLPDGTVMGKYIRNEDFSIFKLQSPNGISLVSRDTEESNKGAGIVISPSDGEGEVQIVTREYDEFEDANIEQLWTYDSKGLLTFPDGTTLGGIYSGTTYFELKTGNNDGFKITNSDDPEDPQTWKFDLYGKLTLPDGTEMGGTQTFPSIFKLKSPYGINIVSGESGETSMGASISISPYNGQGEFQIRTREIGGDEVEITKLWSYDSQGKLSFPDLTVASGNISNTGNFGFDTSPTNSGFSIITAGTSTGTTQLWTFGTNGVLNLPTGGDIKIGGVSVMAGSSNYLMQYFKVTSLGYDLTNERDISPDEEDNSIWHFNLAHVPILNQVAVYIKGTRLSPSSYTISGNLLILDINVWDDDPIGDYEINIDYKF